MLPDLLKFTCGEVVVCGPSAAWHTFYTWPISRNLCHALDIWRQSILKVTHSNLTHFRHSSCSSWSDRQLDTIFTIKRTALISVSSSPVSSTDKQTPNIVKYIVYKPLKCGPDELKMWTFTRLNRQF